MAERDVSKWLGWVVAVVAVAVAFGGASVAMGQNQDDIVELKQTIDTHKVQPAHHDSAARLTLNEERIRVLDEERRDLQNDVLDLKDGQTQIVRRLDALCTASPRCQLKDTP